MLGSKGVCLVWRWELSVHDQCINGIEGVVLLERYDPKAGDWCRGRIQGCVIGGTDDVL